MKSGPIRQQYSTRTRYRATLVAEIEELGERRFPVQDQRGEAYFDQAPTGRGQNQYGRHNDAERVLQETILHQRQRYRTVGLAFKPLHVEVTRLITETIERQFEKTEVETVVMPSGPIGS